MTTDSKVSILVFLIFKCIKNYSNNTNGYDIIK